MKSGVIRLVDAKEKKLSEKAYRDVIHRRKIIADWKFMMGENFRKCILLITPNNQ